MFVSDEVMRELTAAQASPRLRRLALSDCRTLVDEQLAAWLSRSPSLDSLDVAGCTNLKRPPLHLAATLRCVDLSRCPGVEDLVPPAAHGWVGGADGVGGAGGRDDASGDGAGAARDGVDAAAAPMDALGGPGEVDGAVAEVDSGSSAALRAEGATSRGLGGEAHGVSAAGPGSTGGTLPSLVELRLPFCTALTDTALDRVLGAATALQTLDLTGCTRLASPIVFSTSLQRLTLAACHGVSSLEVRCAALRALDISVMPALEELHVVDAAVSALDLSMLPLRRLVIVSPTLASLDLSGCEGLVDVRLDCPCLQPPNIADVATPMDGEGWPS